MVHLTYTSRIPMPAEAVFRFRHDPWNLMRLTPWFLRIHIEAPTRPLQPGDVEHVHIRFLTFSFAWRLVIREVEKDRCTCDEQVSGPFRSWRHEFRVEPRGNNASLLIDTVDFRFFPGPLGNLLDRLIISPLIRLLLAYHHRKLCSLFARPRRWRAALATLLRRR